MYSTRFTHEPGTLSGSKAPAGSSSDQSGLPSSTWDPLGAEIETESQWNSEKWANMIMESECIPGSATKLKQRIAEFMAEASPQEQLLLEESRRDFIEVLERAREGADRDTPGSQRSMIEKMKSMWHATNQVAYGYVQMLDVMVGQAPEYVGLAYGAVKIILVVQVNYEEVKRKVTDYLEQVQLKFKIIDHLTSYIPSSHLVALISQAYSLFYRFLSKAVRYYTQSRAKTWVKALTKPWTRFQEIVDSIDQTLGNIKEVAQYSGLIEGRANRMITQRNLVLLQRHSVQFEKVIELIEHLSAKMDVKSISFTKKEEIRQTGDDLGQSTNQRLNEPATKESNQPLKTDIQAATAGLDNYTFLDELFSELHEAEQQAIREQRAKEELPEMKAYRSERKSFLKSEIALAWAESRESEILWIDGYQLLTRPNFNASFVFPLLQLVETNFETVITVRHFCKGYQDSFKPNKYLLMMQDLVSQLLRQNPSVAQRKKSSITSETTSTTQALWTLFSGLLEEVQTQCVLIIIGGVDNLVDNDPDAWNTRAEIVDRLHALTKTRLVKVILTLSLPQPQISTMESISSLTVYRNQQASPKRTLSLDSMQSSWPTVSLQLTEIQEKRCQKISFIQLPMLYTPGSIIYTRDGKHLQAFVVSDLSGMNRSLSGTFDPLRIRAWSIDHNGTYICKVYRDFQVPYFLGYRETATLVYVPAGYLPDEVTGRGELIARGRLYWSMGSGSHHKQVHIAKRHVVQGFGKFENSEPRNVIVDQCNRPIPPEIIEGLRDQFDVEEAMNVKPRYLMLSPPEITVFDLKHLKWVTCDITSCAEPHFNNHGLDYLVMPEDRKMMFKALVHRRGQSDSLFFLLHGPAGVGKTLTAELIAQTTRRPLLLLNGGDIGSVVTTVEQKLSDWFRLAELWGAVMVLDDANILLEARGVDVERNNIVSVFLKGMDTYHGILFLMTNRIGKFDESVMSRMHAVVHYSQLDSEDRTLVWKNFFDRAREEVEFDWDICLDIIESAEKKHIAQNGRAIRNAFSNAMALAHYRFTELKVGGTEGRAVLRKPDFEQVFAMLADFQESLDLS